MLPQELVDLVLGCLDDKQNLSQCSLVCREWIYPAQRHLFHSIFLSEERVNRIEDSKLGEMLSQGSYLVAFVQELTLMRCYAHTVPVVDLGTLIWAISSLPNLQSLHLCGVNLKPPQIQRELYLPSCGPTMRLDLLKLSDVTVVVTQDSPHACSFLGLVGSFHSIRRLEIVNLFISLLLNFNVSNGAKPSSMNSDNDTLSIVRSWMTACRTGAPACTARKEVNFGNAPEERTKGAVVWNPRRQSSRRFNWPSMKLASCWSHRRETARKRSW